LLNVHGRALLCCLCTLGAFMVNDLPQGTRRTQRLHKESHFPKMETQKREKEYLSGNPNDREIAELDRELARTPRRGSGTAMLNDSVEPPPMLASRTCATIWTTMDSEKQEDYTPNSGTFLDSAFFSPETVLPASYLLGTSEPEEIKSETPRASRRVEIAEDPPRRSSHWTGLIASVSVGMVIAFFLFPMITFVTRSTQSYMTASWENEIHRRIGNYEQIHANQGNAPQNEELLPYNLAASSWQELRVEILSPPPPRYPSRPRELYGTNQPLPSFEAAVSDDFSLSAACPLGLHQPLFNIVTSVSQEESPPVFLLRDFVNWDALISSDMNSMADSMLLVTPGRENTARSAFGQNILLRDGRVFFRILPGAESPMR